MNLDNWLLFVFAALFILIIPGPTVIYAVSQALFHGRNATMPIVLGVLLGDALCILLSLIGLGALLAASSSLFGWVKLVGAGYLVYLGISLFRGGVQTQNINQPLQAFHTSQLTRRAFTITALNPKGIIFFSAFMPQFVNPDNPLFAQFAALGITFLLLAMINMLIYTTLAGKCSELFQSPRLARWFGYCGGTALMTAGLLTLRIDNNG